VRADAAGAAGAAAAAIARARMHDLRSELRAIEAAACEWQLRDLERLIPGIAALANRVARVESQLLFDVADGDIPARVVLAFDIDANLDEVTGALIAAGWALARVGDCSRSLTLADERLLVLDEEHGPQITRIRDGAWTRDQAAEWIVTTPFAPFVELCDELSSVAFARTRDRQLRGHLRVGLGDDLDRPARLLAQLGAVRHDDHLVRVGDLDVESRGGTIDVDLGGIPELAGELPR
jgi:hypothetical protein